VKRPLKTAPSRSRLGIGLILALAGSGLLAQNKSEDTNTRMVQGLVTDSHNQPVANAVVQLKDTKTLQVRSFITQKDGAYHFAGLSTNVDYELKARTEDAASGAKTLSVFNSRKTPVVNLKLRKR
jgi:protocatechuate 3,4-dioxygenase beta subunit